MARRIPDEGKSGCDAGCRSAAGEFYANVQNMGGMKEGGRGAITVADTPPPGQYDNAIPTLSQKRKLHSSSKASFYRMVLHLAVISLGFPLSTLQYLLISL